jgi:ribonuclease BN (tRNA processing enzyme)
MGADLHNHPPHHTNDVSRLRPQGGHPHPHHAIANARAAGARRLCLYHHAPMRSDDDNDRILARYREVVHAQGDRFELLSAHEGLELELGDTP